MTSFISTTFGVVSHLPETVTALLATSRTFMSSSIVPVTLSTDELWDDLCREPASGATKEINFYKIFSQFSDTMQFTEKLRFDHSVRRKPKSSENDNYVLLNSILRSLINNKRYFTRTLRQIEFPNTTSIEILCEDAKMSNIQSLDLRHCGGFSQDRHLKMICTNFTAIKSLTLSYSFLESISEKGLQPISSLKNLEVLDLSLAGQKCISFVKDLKKLKKLYLGRASFWGCTNLDDAAFDFLNNSNEDDASEDILPIFASLLELDVTKCPKVSDHSVIRILKHAPNLSSLCAHLKQKGFAAVSKMKNLVRLEVLKCQNLSEDGFKSLLLDGLPSLQELSLETSTDISNCRCFLDDDKEDDATSSSDHQISLKNNNNKKKNNMRKLQLLKFSHLTDKGLETILSFMPNLESLTLSDNDKITGTTMSNNDKVTTSSLTEIDFRRLNMFNNHGLKCLLNGKTKLRSLHLSGCDRISSGGLCTAFDETNNSNNVKKTLQSLHIVNMFAITDLKFLEGLEVLNNLEFSQVTTELPETADKLPDMVLNSLRSLVVRRSTDLAFAMLITRGDVAQMRFLEFLDISLNGHSDEDDFPVSIGNIDNVVSELPYLKECKINRDLYQTVVSSPVWRKKLGHLVTEFRMTF